MGYAIAEEAVAHGSQGDVGIGAIRVTVPEGVQLVRVQSALDMREAVLARFRGK